MTETKLSPQEQLYELSLKLEQFRRDLFELARLVKETPEEFDPESFEYEGL